MKLAIDAFGGDNAPKAVLAGMDLARKDYPDIEFILTGDMGRIKQAAGELSVSLDGVELVDAPLVMPVEADPSLVRTEYRESSLAKALALVAQDKADAFLSAGSTGAIVFGATFIVKRQKGIKRTALAPILPGENGPFLLLDAGANAECRPEMFAQFAIMGKAYMEKVMGIKDPKVGLVNIGEEDCKGTPLYQEAYRHLKEAPVHFVGNIEAREVMSNAADVIVADGFTGNIILKLIEGVARTFSHGIKDIFSGFSGKLAGLLSLKKIKAFRKKMDYSEYGGSPLLGCSKPVIKAHGSSNANAFKNAIRQARLFTMNDVTGAIRDTLALCENTEKTAQKKMEVAP